MKYKKYSRYSCKIYSLYLFIHALHAFCIFGDFFKNSINIANGTKSQKIAQDYVTFKRSKYFKSEKIKMKIKK